MTNRARKLLTVIAEAALEATLVRDFDRLGARGYTITDVRGKGSRGVRDAGWEVSGNVRIDVVCDAVTAETIAAHVQQRYYADYAMILFLADVEVMRGEKF